VGGFDLHAGIVVRPGDRERLERLCRYTLRPPLAQTRLRVDAALLRSPGPRAPWRAAIVASAGSEFDYSDRAFAA
jgi:Putative transposase